MIRVGTSGFSFQDWKGYFYPPDMLPGDFLRYYCKFFDTVEIASTFYHTPSRIIFEEMEKKTPPSFMFSVKVPREFTHNIEAYESKVAEFREGIQPLFNKKKVVTLLAQFPWSFRPEEKNFEHLKKLAMDFEDTITIEFRNKEWLKETHFDFLKQHRFGFVNLDFPDLPTLIPRTARVTNHLAYVRFHGRNKEQWWNKEDKLKRYDYDYSEEELQSWVGDIRELEKMTGMVYVYFNNFPKAHSVKNASLLKSQLELAKKPVPMQKEHDTKLGEFSQ